VTLSQGVFVRIIVDVGNQRVAECTLEEEETAVIGRAPDLGRAAGYLGSTSGAARTLAIAAPSVSATHVIAHRAVSTTSLIDLHSLNCTWLQLPPGDTVTVASSRDLHLRIIESGRAPESASVPDPPTWTSRADYARGLVAAIAAWFARLRIDVEIEVLTSTPLDRDAPHQHLLPLPIRGYLQVVPRQTVDTSWDQLLAVLWRYVQAHNAQLLDEESTRAEGMILASPAIRQVHREVIDAARSGRRLLLVGPTGAGKDGLARCYHRHTGRAGAFVAKNCAVFDANLLRMELFGAERGAYSGADRTRTGAVEIADGGTLFLDEIGEMKLEVQPYLLTFLDRGEYEPVGHDGKPRRADVALASATNKDLRRAVQDGEFREDLWYRIAGHDVCVPGLAERPEDVEAFLRGRVLPSGVDAFTSLSPGAVARVLSNAWRGNFRELQVFAALLPEARAGEISEATCRNLLDRVGVDKHERNRADAARLHAGETGFAGVAQRAIDSYLHDHGAPPSTWDHVKDYTERYWKPLMCSVLTGADKLNRLEDARLSDLAGSIDADRGTVGKHLARYFERFRT
jgi:hypothetical protein